LTTLEVAKTLYDGTLEAGNTADQLWDDWSFPLHTGDWAGSYGRGAWVLLGLSPVLLGTTGTIMWLQRRKKRQHAKARAAATP